MAERRSDEWNPDRPQGEPGTDEEDLRDVANEEDEDFEDTEDEEEDLDEEGAEDLTAERHASEVVGDEGGGPGERRDIRNPRRAEKGSEATQTVPHPGRTTL